MSDNTKNTADELNIDAIRKITNHSKSDLTKLYDTACQKAFDHIVENSSEKIRKAAENGRTRTYLYTWEYVNDPKDKTYCFNGVRIMDLLTKNDAPLLKNLRNHFNPDNDQDGFKIGWRKFEKRENEATRYGLYVSWYKPQHKNDKEQNAEAEE